MPVLLLSAFFLKMKTQSCYCGKNPLTSSEKEDFLNVLNHVIEKTNTMDNLFSAYMSLNDQCEVSCNYMRCILSGDIQLPINEVQKFFDVMINFIDIVNQLNYLHNEYMEVYEQNKSMCNYVKDVMSKHCDHL